MSTIESLPKGLSATGFERGNLSKHNIPPIRYVPDDKQYIGWGSRKPQMVKVNFASEVCKEYPQLITGTMEDAVKMIKSHDSLVREKKLADKLASNAERYKAKVAELKRLRSKQPMSSKVEDAMSEITNLTGERLELKDAPFNLLGQMVGVDLKTKWEAIIVRECDSTECVDLNGVKQNEKRGRTTRGLHACYVKFLRLFGPEDSAERLKDYLMHHVSLNFHTVTVEQGIS